MGLREGPLVGRLQCKNGFSEWNLLHVGSAAEIKGRGVPLIISKKIDNWIIVYIKSGDKKFARRQH